MILVGYDGFTLDVRVSVRPSVFHFRMITWVNINGFSSNLVCVLILWRSGLGLLMGKFRQFFTELSAQNTHIFISDDNLSKHQWIFTKLGMCIDIVEIWFGIANWQIFSNFEGVFCRRHAHIFVFRTITWVNVKTWYMHWYEGNLIWDCLWANFVNVWQSYLPTTQ